MAVSAANKLRDNVITHTVKLNRVEADIQRQVLRRLKDLEKELVTKIVDIDPTGVEALTFRQRRLIALTQQARDTINTAYRGINQFHKGEMFDVARLETEFTKLGLDSAIGVDLTTVALTTEQLTAVVGDTLIQGAKSSEWWAGQSKNLTDKFSRQMRMGVLQGETTQQLIQRVRGTRAGGFKDGVMNASRREAESLVRTSVQATANSAREATYEANDDVVKGLSWLSTLDGRVTEICLARGGKPYTLDKEPVGHDVPWLEGPGRIHWQCRSTSTAILKSWDELSGPGAVKTGGRPTDIETAFRRRLKAKGLSQSQINRSIRNARASMDGAVPRDVSASEWLRGKSKTFQDRVLGTGRAQLWREGKIPVERLVSKSGRPLSLADLEASLETVKASLAAGPATRGPVQIVRDIFAADPDAAPKVLIQRAVDAGVNPATARTQVTALRRARKEAGQLGVPPATRAAPKLKPVPKAPAAPGELTWEAKKSHEAAAAAIRRALKAPAGFRSTLFVDANKTTSLRRLNLIGEEVTRIVNRFPSLRGSGTALTRIDFRGSKYIPLRSGQGGIMGAYYPADHRMVLSASTSWQDRGLLTLGRNRHNVGKDFASTFRHEWGHAIEEGLFGKSIKPDPRRPFIDPNWDGPTISMPYERRVWAETYRGNRKMFENEVSRYSATDPSEAFAECFSAYTHPEYGVEGERLPKVIEDALERILQ